VSRFRLQPGSIARINEETLRDGEQTPHVIFLAEDKVAIAEALARTLPGSIINAGYPAISSSEEAAVRAVARAVRGADVECAGRATREDLDRCISCVAGAESPRATFWFPVSAVMTGSRLDTTPDGMLDVALDLLAYGQDRAGDRIGLGVALADASNAELDFVIEAVRRLSVAGADMIVVCDTIGRWLPEEVTATVRAILSAVPDAPLCIHAHNDLGLGTANALAALAAGAPAVATAVNGLGERAGMPPTEEVAVALLLRGAAIGRTVVADSTMLLDLSALVAERAGLRPQVTKPIVGSAVLQRETGTQVDWMRRDPRTFQLVTPAFLGRDRYELVLGKMSSRESLEVGLAERGFALDTMAFDQVFDGLKKLSGYQRTITEADILRLVRVALAPVAVCSSVGS
jgi:isopropylmalate/homocitrate/citramalate synthase